MNNTPNLPTFSKQLLDIGQKERDVYAYYNTNRVYLEGPRNTVAAILFRLGVRKEAERGKCWLGTFPLGTYSETADGKAHFYTEPHELIGVTSARAFGGPNDN